jgi:8-amino-3,8-dideoxy-alpha-D-manno-octulosonate transaminase
MPGYELFGDEERQAINDLFEINGGILFAHGFEAMRKGVFRVREFESSMAQKVDVRYAQAVSSGSAALRVAIESIGIQPGDQVIIPSFTYVATAEAVLQSGAELVIVDIDDTFTMDPVALEAAITSKTRIIIPVHMMGAPADLGKINEIAQKFDIKVIEDSAQAVGGSFDGQKLGTIGDLGCFSFDAGKVMNTGEGGMVLTNNEEYFKKARGYHDHGHEYSSTVSRGEDGAIGVGFNYRMMEIQGCIGLAQLAKLDHIIASQRANKTKLKKLLLDSGRQWKFRRLLDDGEIGDTLIFRLPNRETTNQFLQRMKQVGLGTKNLPDAMRWHFARHWSHMFKRFGYYASTYNVEWQKSADLLETAIAIPIMVKMTEERINEVATKLNLIAGELGL